MSKSADAFRTISEVAEWLDTPAHVLRFWESKFTQVKPVKRAGGRRYYRPADMRLLGGIKKLLHEDGMTIKGAQKVLREQGIKHVSSLCTLSLGDEDDGDMIDMQEVVQPDPVDTVVPFSKLETDGADVGPDAQGVTDVGISEETLPDAVTSSGSDAEVSEAGESSGGIEAEVGIQNTSDIDEMPTSQMSDEDATSTDEPAEENATESAPEPVEDTTAGTDEEGAANIEPAPQDASDLPAFLQQSIEERAAEGHAASEQDTPIESPVPETEPAEPVPGALTYLSKITHLSQNSAHQIAPVLERLKEVAR